jgi:hypothetical protein
MTIKARLELARTTGLGLGAGFGAGLAVTGFGAGLGVGLTVTGFGAGFGVTGTLTRGGMGVLAIGLAILELITIGMTKPTGASLGLLVGSVGTVTARGAVIGVLAGVLLGVATGFATAGVGTVVTTGAGASPG